MKKEQDWAKEIVRPLLEKWWGTKEDIVVALAAALREAEQRGFERGIESAANSVDLESAYWGISTIQADKVPQADAEKMEHYLKYIAKRIRAFVLKGTSE